MKEELQKFVLEMTQFNPSINTLSSDNEYLDHIKLIENFFKSEQNLQLPNFANSKQLCIVSDYGGEHSGAQSKTYSFLIFNYEILDFFATTQRELRSKVDIKNKEIAFKNIDRVERILYEYLKNSNNLLHGLLFTLSIDNDVHFFGRTKHKSQEYVKQEFLKYGYTNWSKKEVAEKVAIITHIVAYFIALFVKQGQKILWLTDNDAIMANSEQANDLGAYLGNVVSYYADVQSDQILYGSFDDSETLRDILSLTDLSAGCIEKFLANRDNSSGLKDAIWKVLQWLSYEDGVALHKKTMRIRKEADSSFVGSKISFEPSGENIFEEAFIDVVIGSNVKEGNDEEEIKKYGNIDI